MAACACNSGLSNTGAYCSPIEAVAKKLIFVEYYKTDGTINSVPVSTTFNSAFFTGKVNNADKNLRWYPLPSLLNVTSERAEPVTETAGDGSAFFVQDGVKTFTGQIWGKDAVNGLVSAVSSGRCTSLGVFIVDKDGNLRGNGTADGSANIAPFKVDAGSLSARVIETTDTTVKKIEVKFSFSSDENDAHGVLIAASEMSYSPLNLSGLLDVYATYSGISTTGFTVKLTTKGGTVKNPTIVEDLLAADFALYNVTDAAAVTISTVTETTAGTYAFTFTAQTSADVLRLTPTENGYDFAAVVASTITIP